MDSGKVGEVFVFWQVDSEEIVLCVQRSFSSF
jgi:hypothetical protein